MWLCSTFTPQIIGIHWITFLIFPSLSTLPGLHHYNAISTQVTMPSPLTKCYITLPNMHTPSLRPVPHDLGCTYQADHPCLCYNHQMQYNQRCSSHCYICSTIDCPCSTEDVVVYNMYVHT